MHYGIGNENDVRMHYFEDVMICKLNRLAVIVDARRLGAQALRLAHGYKEYFLQGDRCSQCAERCLRSFTCPPLHNNEPPLPQRAGRNWTSTASIPHYSQPESRDLRPRAEEQPEVSDHHPQPSLGLTSAVVQTLLGPCSPPGGEATFGDHFVRDQKGDGYNGSVKLRFNSLGIVAIHVRNS